MYLTKEEERIFNGDLGWASQKCMRILVRLGELFDATRLIPISSAHVSGVSYKTLGDAPAEYLKALANAGAKVKVRSTLNPQGFDAEYLGKRLGEDIRKKQSDILEQFDKMGFAPSLTCTPYYLKKPKRDSHLAWAESSAVVYANSVLGARTNREGGPSALAAAIIGKTPDYGIHKVENRRPGALVDVATPLRNESELGALGILLGEILEDEIPIIRGLTGATLDQFKQLGAALASTGMVSMFQLEHEKILRKKEKMQEISVESRDIQKIIERLSTTSTTRPDLVFLGCPHCSISELKNIARLTDGRKVKAGTEFWVCTSRCVKEMAKDYVGTIEKSGAHVLADVCTIVSWTEAFGIETIMTNSAKTAYYAPSLNKAQTVLVPQNRCLEAALRG